VDDVHEVQAAGMCDIAVPVFACFRDNHRIISDVMQNPGN
jgi:hypothetical protein